MNRLLTFLFSFAIALSAFTQDSGWALVNISVANIRTQKGNSSELSSQELMGMPVKLLNRDGDWWQVQTADGYTGWMRGESLAYKNTDQLRNWRHADRLVVTSMGQIKAYATPVSTGSRDIVTDLVPCNIVEGNLADIRNGKAKVTLPDGRIGWVDALALTPIEEWAAQTFNPFVVLNQAYSLIGTPYLWGGTSVKALDCSGLSKISYLANGIFLRRDASMQAKTGQELDLNDWPNFQAGDLLFFGNASTGKVTHVAIYDHDGIFVHSTGTGDRVRINSLNPDSPDAYRLKPIKAVRINGKQGTDGIIQARKHPWLFD